MPHKDQPTDPAYAPSAYPQPDWEAGHCDVVEVYVPQVDTVGWLMRDGDALAWLSNVAADHPGYAIRRHVELALRTGALDQQPAGAVGAELLRSTLHTPTRRRSCPDVLAEVRGAWG